MVSKRRIRIRWRIFVPIFVLAWSTTVGLVFWQMKREKEFRREYVASLLTIVNNRATALLDKNETDEVNKFISFVDDFFARSKLFSKIRVTIYDNNWAPIDSVGTAVRVGDIDKEEVLDPTPEPFGVRSDDGEEEFLYQGATTKDGTYHIVSALPMGTNLNTFISGSRNEVLIITFIVMVIATILIYITARHFGYNVTLLRNFAVRAANDPDFIPAEDYTHDELGDIARLIVNLYNERGKQRLRIQHEHEVAMHAIEERARERHQLTSNINHEFKTPIGVIKGYLDTLCDTPDLDPEIRDHFTRKAREHANRLVDLIADISAITRLEEGNGMINTERVDMHETVYILAEDVKDSGLTGEIEFTYDIPKDLYVRANLNLLTGMLLNLVKNAVNYSRGTFCRLEYLGEADGLCTFTFYDNGTGVPERSLPYLFDRFYRVDSGRARKSGGTGLGLPIVQNTILAHGGTITVSNRQEGGLQFIFTLPKA